MRKFIVLILLAVIMASCMTEEKARKRFPCPSLTFFKIQRDTIEKLKVVETVIPSDSGWIKALIQCDSNGQAYIRQIQELKNGKKTKPFIKIGKDNVITAGASVDSQAVYTAFKERFVREATEKIIQLPSKEIKFVPKWIRFFAWSGGVAWGIVLLLLGIQLFKIARKVWPI